MKLLFLLTFAPLCLSRCPPNHYKDDVFKKCRECTPCHVTLSHCSPNKDAVCAPFNIDNPSGNHHFQVNRIHFIDDTVSDDDYHAKHFLPHQKAHHIKFNKHKKTNIDDKHHHYKKKHYEFNDDEDDTFGNYDDDFDFNYEKVDKPKKHKKHYEFNKKHNNKNHKVKSSSEEDIENKKIHFTFDEKKHKETHPKSMDIDEKQLEEWLIQSEKKLKMSKDNLLKTLKDEKKTGSKVRLNSPVLNLSDDESFDGAQTLRSSSSGDKSSDADALKALADLHEADDDAEDDDDEEDDGDFDDDLTNDEGTYKPAPPLHSTATKKPSHIIGQGKDVDEMIRSEMGKNVIFEKSHFNVIPFVVGKDFKAEKKSFATKYHAPTKKQEATWDDEGDDVEYQEIKTNDVVSLPFSAAERLVWDWQAVAVASAVAACFVFFLVIAVYFLLNTTHWKKTSKGYSKDLEEVSTRIALMQPMLDLGTHDSRYYVYMDNMNGLMLTLDKAVIDLGKKVFAKALKSLPTKKTRTKAT